MIELYNEDCLKTLDRLIEQDIKVDAIITDPPYGTTACKWDNIIPFNEYIYIDVKKKQKLFYKNEAIIELYKQGYTYADAISYFENNKKEGMWERLNKLIKPNGAIILFGSEPFSSALRMSNIKNYKYDWVWNKVKGGNFLNLKYQPYKVHEIISVFSNGTHSYYPIKIPQIKRSGKIYKSSDSAPIKYNDGIKRIYKDKYPKSILTVSNANQKGKVHPTQKPVALMEYLIKTYTNEGETVLDFTMGSGSTLVACENTNRNGIGIEKDKTYFDIAVERVNEVIESNNIK